MTPRAICDAAHKLGAVKGTLISITGPDQQRWCDQALAEIDEVLELLRDELTKDGDEA